MNSADPKSQSLPRHLSPWRQTITLPLLYNIAVEYEIGLEAVKVIDAVSHV